MEREVVINKILRDLKMNGLISEESNGDVKLYLNALWVAAWEAKGAEHGDRRSKEIVQCNRNGCPMKEFHNSIYAAKELKCARLSIRKSLETGKPTSKGYIWKYKQKADR